jgi:hypothetical protein
MPDDSHRRDPPPKAAWLGLTLEFVLHVVEILLALGAAVSFLVATLAFCFASSPDYRKLYLWCLATMGVSVVTLAFLIPRIMRRDRKWSRADRERERFRMERDSNSTLRK